MSLDKWMRVNEKFSKCNLKNFVGESTFDVDVTNKKNISLAWLDLNDLNYVQERILDFEFSPPAIMFFIKSLCKGTENMNLFSLKVFIKIEN